MRADGCWWTSAMWLCTYLMGRCGAFMISMVFGETHLALDVPDVALSPEPDTFFTLS